MAEADAACLGDPNPLHVWPSMMQPGQRALESDPADTAVTRDADDEPAHVDIVATVPGSRFSCLAGQARKGREVPAGGAF